MNNLEKEVSAYLLNDTQFERAVNTLLLEILKPVKRAIEQQNWNGGDDWEELNPEIYARWLFILDLLNQMDSLRIMSNKTISDKEALENLNTLKDYLEIIKERVETDIEYVEKSMKDLQVAE